ncbi:MAG: 30S ribosomal protein S17 [bacterium]
MQNSNKTKPFSMIGFVASDRMDKTRVIVVEKMLKHPKYGKPIRKKIKYKAHDDNNQTHVGDKVEIALSRPMSREKRWRITKVIEKAQPNLDKGEMA